MATKYGRMVTYLEKLLTIKIFNTFFVVLQGHVTNENHYISTTRVPMTTKLGRMITYLDGIQPIKPHDPRISWCGEIT